MGVVVKQPPEILAAIVGTAGHVDHGKTSLVRLLTGCDTDRLPEEKTRGMSIDLGFAPCLLHGRRLVGIVDVPGHKDFIRNMVAGAASIDVLLLVVAADDGVMPQTIEHLRIVRLLRDPLIMVALTKIDVVAADMVDLARQDVADLLGQNGFGDAPIIAVSNKTGDGISDIRDAIDRLVEQVQQKRANSAGQQPRAFRMNVERVFSVKGYGTVVTGIPVSGRISAGDKVELLPAGQELTVRAIQSYKIESQTAQSNCCAAINVREIDAQHVTRGMTIASVGAFRATRELVAQIQNASDTQTFKRRFDATFLSGTAAVAASIKLLEAENCPPAQQAFAHVLLEEPLVLSAGDRFIVRSASPSATIGGGVVLSAKPQTFRRHAPIAPRLTLALDAARQGDLVGCELLAGPDVFVASSEIARLSQHPNDGHSHTPHAIDLGGGAWAVGPRAAEAAQLLIRALTRYHQQHAFDWGMNPALACEALGLGPKNFDRLAQLFCTVAPIAIKHGRLALAGHQVAVSERLLKLREQILAQISSAGVNGPARGDIMRTLGIAEKDMQVLSKLLISDGSVVMLDGSFILRSVLDGCRDALRELFTHERIVPLAAFRDAIGGHRKLAVAMLDAFDAEGLTCRVPDGRVLVEHARGPAMKGAIA